MCPSYNWSTAFLTRMRPSTTLVHEERLWNASVTPWALNWRSHLHCYPVWSNSGWFVFGGTAARKSRSVGGNFLVLVRDQAVFPVEGVCGAPLLETEGNVVSFFRYYLDDDHVGIGASIYELIKRAFFVDSSRKAGSHWMLFHRI